MNKDLTQDLLDILEVKFSAEREHRKISWLDQAKFDLEIKKFQDAMKRSDEREREAHIKDRKQREQKFINLRQIMMRQRHQTWEDVMQDFRRKYAAIPKDDKEAQQKFIFKIYKSYYFPDTLIGDITNRPAKVVSLMIEDWTFENEDLKG